MFHRLLNKQFPLPISLMRKLSNVRHLFGWSIVLLCIHWSGKFSDLKNWFLEIKNKSEFQIEDQVIECYRVCRLS